MPVPNSVITSATALAFTFLSASKAAFLPVTKKIRPSRQFYIPLRRAFFSTVPYTSQTSGSQRFHSLSNLQLNQSKQETMNDHRLETIQILPFRDHTHNSAKIVFEEEEDISDLDRKLFKARLEATVETCRHLNKSSVWISVPMCHAGLIESMVNISGLEFHHATGRVANLCMWLKDDIESKIPEFATHHVGVGAMVINSRNDILCVREIRNNYRPWKIPGGLAELGEQIDIAAIREVKEETGIDCSFKSVLTFRHTHNLQFGRSDLYFVCMLEPKEVVDASTNEAVISDPVAQAGEIAAATWLPLHEYRSMVNGDDPHPMMQKVLELYDENNAIQQTLVNSIVPGRKPSPMYHSAMKNNIKSDS